MKKIILSVIFLGLIIAPVLVYAGQKFNTELKFGSRGGEVKLLQEELIKQGFFKGKPTLYFGNITKSALIKYQKKNNLKQTGKTDIATRDKLNKTITPLANNTTATDEGQYNLPQNLMNGVYPKFDDTVIKSVLRLKIYDNVLKQDILWGSGISIGGFGDILTNYHVVEKAITDPARYQVYGCVTNSLNTQCDYFNYFLSITSPLPSNIKSVPKYDKKFDLALVYINQVYFDNKWSAILNTSLNTLKDHTVNLSSYTKNINDLYVDSQVYSIGYPDYGEGSTVQAGGVIKELFTDKQSGQKLILSSINISHGNSGGPVFNSKGELVGVTVACLVASPDTEKCKTNSGLFIPLPTVNWWYANVTKSEIITWEGKQSYLKQSDTSWQGVLCSLRQNAYYDANISADSCVCKIGYKVSSNGDCLGEANTTNNPLIKYGDTRYGQAPDREAEQRALKSLTDMLDSLGGSSNGPLPSSEQQINDQTCVKNYGPNRVWDGNKNRISCTCKEGTLFFPNEILPNPYEPGHYYTSRCIDPKTITKPVTCGNGCSYD